MKYRQRQSLRLKAFDYSGAGEYFVTTCTHNRACILGEIVDGKMRLSQAGEIVERCWRDIPSHFEKVRVDTFQIMPNHVHGIIEIRNPIPGKVSSGGAVTAPPTYRFPLWLGRIVAYFKYQATKRINEVAESPGRRVFQRNYHDHIIRDDIEHYLIQQYIELNPIVWHLDVENSSGRALTIEQLREYLKSQHGLHGYALDTILNHEMSRSRTAEVVASNIRERTH